MFMNISNGILSNLTYKYNHAISLAPLLADQINRIVHGRLKSNSLKDGLTPVFVPFSLVNISIQRSCR